MVSFRMVTPLLKHPDFRRGVKAGLVAGVSFFFIFFSFGIYAMHRHFPAQLIPLFTILVYAAPAQYAVVDMMGSSASIWQLILVGVMVNVRFFVWGLAMSHEVRHVPLRKMLFWSYFVAASTFLIPLFDKRKNPGSDFYTFYRGVVTAAFPMMLCGTLLGMAVQEALPPSLVFASSLLLPVYFGLLLVSDIKKKIEVFSVSLTFLVTPLVEIQFPGWGVIFSAVLLATTALGARVWMRRAGW